MDDSIVEWLLTEGDPAVSIYMPVDPSQRDLRAPAARLRNLIKAAEESLEGGDGTWKDHASILAPVREFADATDFRFHRDPGLALFLADGRLQTLPLPEPPPELVVVGRSFHLKPLLQILNQDRRFYILALSAGDARLLAATPFASEEVQMTDLLPPDAAAQADSRLAAETGSDGHGADVQKSLLLQDWHRVAKAVGQRIGADPAPVVLAAEPGVAGAFAKVAHLPQLLPPVHVNPFGIAESELRMRAMERIRPILQAARTTLLGQLASRLGAGDQGATAKVEDILLAARDGRVDALAVAGDEAIWGRFDAEAGAVVAHAAPDPGDEDLLNLAAVLTLRQGGRAFTVPRSEMPAHYSAAATLRF